jgi:hypothetical protein
MKMHKSVTLERIMEMTERSTFGAEDDGVCVACGQDQMGVEPDAERLPCESCGRNAVYGAEQLLLLTVA